jgi:putative OmpL-like beta-barrel porin-2
MRVKMTRSVSGLLLAFTFLIVGPAWAQEAKRAQGWLSLDSSVGVLDTKVEAGKSVLEKSLGISISGFFDAGYNWSSNHPSNPANITGRYFDKDYNKLTFNDFNLTVEKPEKDWGVGVKVVSDFGRTAELLREATLWGKALHKQPSVELREAYLTTTIPVGEGLQVKGGKFVTPLGTEILPAPGSYNNNISRSFAFNFGVPWTHLGMLFTYPVLNTLSVSAGVVTGWDDPHDNNNAPSFLGGLNFTPADTFSFASNMIIGREWAARGVHVVWGHCCPLVWIDRREWAALGTDHPVRSGGTRVAWSNVATMKPIDPLTVYLEYTLGHEDNALTPVGTRGAWWHALAFIGSYNWTERFNSAVRGELFYDAQAARTFGFASWTPTSRVSLGEVTVTGSYRFTNMLLGRAEVRQDWITKTISVRAKTDEAHTTLAVQLIYTF